MSGNLPQAAGILWVILHVEVRQRSEAPALLISTLENRLEELFDVNEFYRTRETLSPCSLRSADHSC